MYYGQAQDALERRTDKHDKEKTSDAAFGCMQRPANATSVGPERIERERIYDETSKGRITIGDCPRRLMYVRERDRAVGA